MRNKAFSKKILCLVVIGSMMSPTLAFAQSSTLVVTQPINNSAALTKDETVFTTLDSTGVAKSTSVTSWIHSDNMLSELKDKSNLTNIKNLKSSETPTKSGDSLVWKTDKSDIFYSGDSNKALPISVKIKYYLDDKEISAKDLAGKSGKVKIKIDFDNNTKKMVNINGKARTVCEAIPITTIIDMPVGNFSKITATDGTIMKVGNNNVLTFISVPGFQESLGLKNGDLGVTLANSVVVTADAKDFKLAPIYFMASPELLDLDSVAGGPTVLSDIMTKVNVAKAGISQLVAGSQKLDKLMGEFQEKFTLLNTKLNTTAVGADGKPQGLKAATSAINDGVKMLDSSLSSTAIVNGKPTGIQTATSQIVAGINAINTAINDYNINPANGTKVPSFKATAASLMASIGSKATTANPMGDPTTSLTDAINALNLLIQSNPSDPRYAQMNALISGLVATTKKPTTAAQASATTLYNGVAFLNTGLSSLGAQTASAIVSAGEYKNNIDLLTAKVHDPANGLAASMGKLNENVGVLASSVNDLKVLGVDKLKAEGTAPLATGLGSLAGQITPIMAKVDDVMATKDEMVKIAKENSSFSGVDPSMKGSMKFVMQTGDIKVGDSSAKKEVKVAKKSFLDKVYDAFMK